MTLSLVKLGVGEDGNSGIGLGKTLYFWGNCEKVTGILGWVGDVWV